MEVDLLFASEIVDLDVEAVDLVLLGRNDGVNVILLRFECFHTLEQLVVDLLELA